VEPYGYSWFIFFFLLRCKSSSNVLIMASRSKIKASCKLVFGDFSKRKRTCLGQDWSEIDWKYRRNRQITSVHKSFLSFLFYTLCGLLHPSWIFLPYYFFLSRHIDRYNFASCRFLSSPLYQRQLYFLMLYG